MKPSDAARKRVLESFSVEHRDHLVRLETLERDLAQGSWKEETVANARRSLHSLKGTARLLNFPFVEQLAHRGETLLLLYDDMSVEERRVDWVRTLRDALEDSVAAALAGKRSPSAERAYRDLGTWVEADESEDLPQSFEGELDPQRQVVRVQVNQLENLIRASGRIGAQPFALQEGLRQLRQQVEIGRAHV